MPISFSFPYSNRHLTGKQRYQEVLLRGQDICLWGLPRCSITEERVWPAIVWWESSSDFTLIWKWSKEEMAVKFLYHFQVSEASTEKYTLNYVFWVFVVVVVLRTAIALWISASFHIYTASRWDNKKTSFPLARAGSKIFSKQTGRSPELYKHFSSQMNWKSVAVF